jgi:hypothetical protein
MRTPGTQGSRDALNGGKVINGPLGGRNASQAHRARSDSDSPVDDDDARQDAPLRRRWRLCQQLCTIYASLSKELLPPWGGVEITNGQAARGAAVVNALAKAGVPRPKGKAR